MGLTMRVLGGLAAGLLTGSAIAALGHPYLDALVSLLAPLGDLWVSAIRMTVIPLVLSLQLVSIGSIMDARAVGRIGGRGFAFFLLLLTAAGALTVVIAAPLFRWLPIAPGAVEALRARARIGATPPIPASEVPSLSDWIVEAVPTNPFAAASEGALLPLIVFVIAFGIAATRLPHDLRQLLVRFFGAVSEAMQILVRWILSAAPVGVFALALPLAGRLGLTAAGALAYYVAAVSILCVLVMVAQYPFGMLFGGVGMWALSRALMPAQGVAFSSRSSLAALPALMEGSRSVLGLRPSITGLFIPLSASVFRLAVPVGIIAGVLFLARLYGVGLGTPQLVTITVAAIFLSFSVPGIPGGSILIIVPVLVAAGVPVEGVGLLLAVDTVPDMFRTTANVTAHMALAAVLDGGSAGDVGQHPAIDLPLRPKPAGGVSPLRP